MENNEAKILLVGMAIVTAITALYSIHVHLTEANKRKHLARMKSVWEDIMKKDFYINASPAEKLQYHEAFMNGFKK